MSNGTQDSALICYGQEALMARFGVFSSGHSQVYCPVHIYGPQNTVEYSTLICPAWPNEYTTLISLIWVFSCIFFLIDIYLVCHEP